MLPLTGLLALILGIAVLVLAARFLVDAASDLGRRMGLPPTVMGITIVALGTSAPELAVVTRAVLVNDTELAVGSVVGSNIANLLLVLGLAAAVTGIRAEARLARIDVPVMVGASALLVFFARDNRLEQAEGGVLIAILLAFLGWTVATNRVGRDASRSRAARERTYPVNRLASGGPLRSILILAAGTVGLAVAARVVVDGAESIARGLGIPELIVGLTIVAVGTSAPEIATTIVAVRAGRADLALGNAVGSNTMNILFVLGLPTVLSGDGLAFSDHAVRLDLPVLLVSAVATFALIFRDRHLQRWEGRVFLAAYLTYVTVLTLGSMGHPAKGPVIASFAITAAVLVLANMAQVVVRRRRADETRTIDRTRALDNPRPRNTGPLSTAIVHTHELVGRTR